MFSDTVQKLTGQMSAVAQHACRCTFSMDLQELHYLNINCIVCLADCIIEVTAHLCSFLVHCLEEQIHMKLKTFLQLYLYTCT